MVHVKDLKESLERVKCAVSTVENEASLSDVEDSIGLKTSAELSVGEYYDDTFTYISIYSELLRIPSCV